MTPLPLDVARCPGSALVDLRTKRHYLDEHCDDCPRLLQAEADRRQWQLDGRPRIEGGRPAMAGAWMTAPDRMDWIDGICPVRSRDDAAGQPG